MERTWAFFLAYVFLLGGEYIMITQARVVAA
jgi:hypothetical protein